MHKLLQIANDVTDLEKQATTDKTARYRLTRRDQDAVEKAVEALANSDVGDMASHLDWYGRLSPLVEELLEDFAEVAEDTR